MEPSAILRGSPPPKPTKPCDLLSTVVSLQPLAATGLGSGCSAPRLSGQVITQFLPPARLGFERGSPRAIAIASVVSVKLRTFKGEEFPWPLPNRHAANQRNTAPSAGAVEAEFFVFACGLPYARIVAATLLSASSITVKCSSVRSWCIGSAKTLSLSPAAIGVFLRSNFASAGCSGSERG